MKSVRFFLFVFPVTVFATTLVEQYLPESPAAADSTKKDEIPMISVIEESSQMFALDENSTKAVLTKNQENSSERGLIAAQN